MTTKMVVAMSEPVPAILRRLHDQAERRPWREVAVDLAAKGLPLRPRALQRYQEGTRSPDLHVLVALLDVLGATDADWLGLRDAVRERLQRSTSAALTPETIPAVRRRAPTSTVSLGAA